MILNFEAVDDSSYYPETEISKKMLQCGIWPLEMLHCSNHITIRHRERNCFRQSQGLHHDQYP